MNKYQLEQILGSMVIRYGRFRNGEEELHSRVLYPMESNALKINRLHPKCSSACMEEAVLLALHKVGSCIGMNTGSTLDYETNENILLRNALLASFDPFSNSEINSLLRDEWDVNMDDAETLGEYFREPAQCLMRIMASIRHWKICRGSNGYFEFLESRIGDRVPGDDVMNYCVLVGKEYVSGIANYFP